jgi:hypothetical protein
MKAVVVFPVVFAAVCLSACDGFVMVISTGPSTLQGSTLVGVVHVDGGVIPIGTPVSGALTTRGGDVLYQVIPPRTGILVLGVSWNKSAGALDVLFASNVLPRPIGAAPYNARFPVQAGQTYVLRIADGGGAAVGTPNVPFMVTTAIE